MCYKKFKVIAIFQEFNILIAIKYYHNAVVGRVYICFSYFQGHCLGLGRYRCRLLISVCFSSCSLIAQEMQSFFQAFQAAGVNQP